jgi:small Trp-rich protein
LFDLAQAVTACCIGDFVVDKGHGMWFLGLGLVFLFMKVQGFAPVAAWPWWGVLAPFGLAAAWWTWADASGYTKRKAVERDTRRVQSRVERQREAMGLPPKRK